MSRWPSWDPVPNKHTVSLDAKRHFNQYVAVVDDELLIAKHVSGLGNQHNNGPYREQISDNPSTL